MTHTLKAQQKPEGALPLHTIPCNKPVLCWVTFLLLDTLAPPWSRCHPLYIAHAVGMHGYVQFQAWSKVTFII